MLFVLFIPSLLVERVMFLQVLLLADPFFLWTDGDYAVYIHITFSNIDCILYIFFFIILSFIIFSLHWSGLRWTGSTRVLSPCLTSLWSKVYFRYVFHPCRMKIFMLPVLVQVGPHLLIQCLKMVGPKLSYWWIAMIADDSPLTQKVDGYKHSILDVFWYFLSTIRLIYEWFG